MPTSKVEVEQLDNGFSIRITTTNNKEYRVIAMDNTDSIEVRSIFERIIVYPVVSNEIRIISES